MVKLFFGNRSFALIFLPFIVFMFYVFNIFFGQQKNIEHAFFGFLGDLSRLNNIFFQILAPITILINSIMLNNLFNRNEFMENNNFLLSLLYVVAMSFLPSFYFLDNVLLAQTCLILMLSQVFKLNQNKDGRKHTFNAFFFFGVACSIYPNVFLGLPIMFFTVGIFRPFLLREFFLALTGFLLPILYSSLYFFIFKPSKLYSLIFVSDLPENSFADILLFAFLLLFFLIGISKILKKVRSSNIRLKKLFRALFFLLLFSFIYWIIEFFVFKSTKGLGLVIIPLMFIIPYAFGERKVEIGAIIIYYSFFFLALGKFFIPIDLLKI